MRNCLDHVTGITTESRASAWMVGHRTGAPAMTRISDLLAAVLAFVGAGLKTSAEAFAAGYAPAG